jgi:hypothetical protein
MREIDLNSRALEPDTFLIYGGTGSGKTTGTAGWPRPLVLADESEGGYKALKGLSDDQLFEPGIQPIVWGIREMGDVATALDRIPPLIASHKVMTVIINSITFYSETYLAHLNAQRPGADSRQIYGDLSIHLRQVRTRFHNLGVNIVWEALDAKPEDAVLEKGVVVKSAQPGRPMISGRQAEQFAAGVTHLWRATLDVVQKDGKPHEYVWKLQTRQGGAYAARSRIGVGLPQLPNPMTGGYKGFLRAQGLDVEQIRRSLPPIATPPRPAQPAKPAQPTTVPRVASPPSAPTTTKK